jgi:hypothetical protein
MILRSLLRRFTSRKARDWLNKGSCSHVVVRVLTGHGRALHGAHAGYTKKKRL